jgi:hypothetical protein
VFALVGDRERRLCLHGKAAKAEFLDKRARS